MNTTHAQHSTARQGKALYKTLISFMTILGYVNIAHGQCDHNSTCLVIGPINEASWSVSFSSGDYVVPVTKAVALAVATSTHPCPLNGNGSWPMDGVTYDINDISAFAFSHFDKAGEFGIIWSESEAGIGSTNDWVGGYVRTEAIIAPSCCPGGCTLPQGSWAGYAADWALLVGSGPYTSSLNAVIKGLALYNVPTLSRSAVQVIRDDGTPTSQMDTIAIWYIEDKKLLDGYVYDPQDDSYHGDLIFSGNDLTRIEIRPVSFNDAQLDVNGDGRFNHLDSIELFNRFGSSSNTDIPFFDFDGSGVIDQPDVDFLDSLIAGGLDSGILGDYNQDGIADCADLSAMGSGWNYVLGDANYRVEIDADLDGDNDATDYNAVYDILQPADINDDGNVNSQDIAAFLNLYNAQDPAADVNGDGQVNTSDWIMFLNLWNNPC